MHYYDKVARATKELEDWIVNDDRSEWSTFCRNIMMTYGFPPQRMERTINLLYPKLHIINDKLEVKN